MQMLKGTEIAEAELTDWRKLAHGLHRTRRRIGDPAGPRPRATDHRDRRRPQGRGRPGLGQRHRARPRHGTLRDHRPGVGRLLTGSADARGHGSPSDEIRDASGRVPNLWFGDADEHETPRRRFNVEVYVAPEVVGQRIAAALAAGGTVVDDSDAPSLTVIADQDGNTGVICVDAAAATRD